MKRHVLIVVLGLAALAPPAQAASPGADSIGDPLFPQLGNGGYEVKHYDLDLRYATNAPSQPIDGTATILARATQSLSRFDLDFAGGGIASVSVNGRAAAWTRSGEELVITPMRALKKGRPFVVRVSHFTATPTPPDVSVAFFITPDGSATAPQPDLAHDIFPSNDHPADKASFTFRLDVPSDVVAVASGFPAGHRRLGSRAVWRYVQRQPMATQLVQIAVGKYDVRWGGVHRGVPIRDLTSPALTQQLLPSLELQPSHLEWMRERVGRYPFDIYGSLVLDTQLGFALETQTLSLYDRYWFDNPIDLWDPTMVHELAHSWFGDDVSVERWSDLWLSEGHASWYEFLYAEEKGFLEGDTEGYPDETGYATFEALMKAVYAHGDEWRAADGPVARPLNADVLFGLNRYHGGALVLYALRQKVGTRTFDRIERAWLHRYGGRSASTEDFIALASRVSGRDLRRFLRDWLYGTTTPPMPGHPDWATNPVTARTSALARSPRARPVP